MTSARMSGTNRRDRGRPKRLKQAGYYLGLLKIGCALL
jgi:hypothetical protein